MNDLELGLRWARQADELSPLENRRALDLALRARDLLARCELEGVGKSLWSALQADAWAVLGSCWRACGELRRAESALTIAWSFLADGPLHDPLSPHRLAQRAAQVRGDQGRFDEAFRLIESAIEGYRQLGEKSWVGAACIDQARLLDLAGKAPAAVVCLEQALAELDPQRDAHLRATALHNRALLLDKLADGWEAKKRALAALQAALAQHTELEADLALLKGSCQIALVALERGHFAEGKTLLWRCHELYHRVGAPRGELWALLHLLVLAKGEGQPDQLSAIAGLLFPLQSTLGLAPDGQKALRELIQKAQRHEFSPEEITPLVDRLQAFRPT